MNIPRFIVFCDGNNFEMTLKHLRIRIDNYGAFYQYCFEQAVKHHKRTFSLESRPPASQLSRILWFVVGSMDEWDLTDQRSIDFIRANYNGPMSSFNFHLNEIRTWYDTKVEALKKKKSFYHGVQSSTDCLEMVTDGHWRVDFIHEPKSISEKGVDTGLAVAMCSQLNNYDVGLVLSNDTDYLPSIKYARSMGKHIGIFQFLSDIDNQNNLSIKLMSGVDFVIPILDSDLLKSRIAYRW